MARPRSITNEQILDAARIVFLERGPGATTAEIAAKAKISEGSIFKRFNTKTELFQAALGASVQPGWFEVLPAAMEMGLQEGLMRVGQAALDFFIEMIPRLNMMLSSLPEVHQGLPTFSREGMPVKAIRMLAGLMQHWQQKGLMRQTDPEVGARMFLGAIFHFAFTEVSGINRWLPMPRQQFLEHLVENLAQGLEAR